MRKRKLPSLVSILILTLITVVMWVTFDVYRLFNKPSEPVVPEEVSRPLDSKLDQEVINTIESRLFFEDDQVTEPVITEQVTTEQVVEDSVVAEESPAPENP